MALSLSHARSLARKSLLSSPPQLKKVLGDYEIDQGALGRPLAAKDGDRYRFFYNLRTPDYSLEVSVSRDGNAEVRLLTTPTEIHLILYSTVTKRNRLFRDLVSKADLHHCRDDIWMTSGQLPHPYRVDEHVHAFLAQLAPACPALQDLVSGGQIKGSLCIWVRLPRSGYFDTAWSIMPLDVERISQLGLRLNVQQGVGHTD